MPTNINETTVPCPLLVTTLVLSLVLRLWVKTSSRNLVIDS